MLRQGLAAAVKLRAIRVFVVFGWLSGLALRIGALANGPGLLLPLPVFPGFRSVGALLAFYRPRLSIGWLLLATALLPAFAPTAEVANGIVIVGCGLLVILSPTGRPVSGRWWGQ